MTQLSQLKGIGKNTLAQLEKLQIFTLDDLLFHLPRDYEDRSTIIPIYQLQAGRSYLIQGIVKSSEFSQGKRQSLAITLDDGSGKVTLRFYHFYKTMIERMAVGKVLRVFGEARLGVRGIEFYHPEVEQISQTTPLPKTQLTAIYPSTDGLTQKKLRELIQQAIENTDDLVELLPAHLTNGYDLKQALVYIHQPPKTANMQQLLQGSHPAQQRLIFEELVAHQVSLLQRRQYIQHIQAPTFTESQSLKQQLLERLPYKITNAQQRVSMEIAQDMAKNVPMLRLVQGDVGAGKTLVAGLASCHVLEQGWQVALMAPTEILAEQHYLNFKQWFEPLGITVTWLVGKIKGKARQKILDDIQSNQAQMIIGTHALFQEQVQFAQLGLVMIDEQHRFGVEQRLALRNKNQKVMPHQLALSATPIPRSLAMNLYGDLDSSIIDELPPNRTPIQTVTVAIDRREEVLQRVIKNCMEDKQAYWVCTLVEQSESLDAQAAEVFYQEVQQRFPHVNVGLIHGKMKADEKQSVMMAFKNNELQLLIATTVIEVGVDVPNASIMIIENAERLGLSQLHQLRGRVGRGAKASFCVLMYKNPLSQNGQERLNILRESHDGFVIAEKDLELRGAGELLGTQQTGDMGFRVANLQRDEHLLEQAHQTAYILIEQYPQNAEQLVKRWLPNATRYAYV
ncbi:ATP-dependent DNA helicase RecG [Moraxella sp. ZY210820]|uniref:ATP-dependent DNA helicase RecG n=1 Tax=unclassified Moraxella TaxID=2685852 RepID=UPI00272F2F83|nr:ATP-dependent DNA helicase RecG [Moraxella sp. ZY210820]WLF84202.1 ATP-dependent DNA helicase RecG [Moraxella sp. ZY210820]